MLSGDRHPTFKGSIASLPVTRFGNRPFEIVLSVAKNPSLQPRRLTPADPGRRTRTLLGGRAWIFGAMSCMEVERFKFVSGSGCGDEGRRAKASNGERRAATFITTPAAAHLLRSTTP